MPRCWLTLVALLIPAAVAAAPVPKPATKPIEGVFGTPVATKGVTCEMTAQGVLRVGVSKEAAAEAKAHEDVRPLVARKVEGDFELTVRMAHTPPAGENLAAIDRDKLTVSAGIALYKADGKRGSLVVLNRVSNGREGWDSYFKMKAVYQSPETQGVTGALSSHQTLSDSPIYVRLTRRGDEFTAARGEDGKAWSPVFDETHTVSGLGPAVMIGPTAAHNTTGRYDVTFDEYVLKPLKKGEKK